MRVLLVKSITALLLLGAVESQAQGTTPAIQHSGLYGGSKQDSPLGIVQTEDGGFFIGGASYSSDGHVPSKYKSNTDALVVRTDDTGKYLWSTVFGGSDYEELTAVAASGSMLVATGYTWSNDGDYPGGKRFNPRGYVAWFDPADGHVIRNRVYTGDNYCYSNDIKIQAGNKILLCGYQSNTGMAVKPLGESAWVALLDDTGRIVWERFFGGSAMGGYSRGVSVLQKQDGGFMALASTAPVPGGTIPGHHGLWDFALANMDTLGNIIWIRYYGGSGSDMAREMVQTQDGGFLLAGATDSKDGDVAGGTHGTMDYWVVKVDKDGKVLWQKTYGGTQEDQLLHMAATCDNGAILQGMSPSIDGDAVGNKGVSDQLLIRIDDKGTVLWSHCFGSNMSDPFGDIIVTADGNYALTACNGLVNNDVTGTGAGASYWLAIFGTDGLSNYCPLPEPPEPKEPPLLGLDNYNTIALKIYPNPVSNQLHIESALPLHAVLSDLQGRVLLQSGKGDMDMSALADGLYLLSCRDLQGNLVRVEKIQKTSNR